jgi:hypothetical protein
MGRRQQESLQTIQVVVSQLWPAKTVIKLMFGAPQVLIMPAHPVAVQLATMGQPQWVREQSMFQQQQLVRFAINQRVRGRAHLAILEMRLVYA